MDVEDVAALRQAVDDCGDRGLLAASKWAADLLQCVPLELRASAMRYSQQQAAAGGNVTNDQFEAQEREEDLIRAAKGFIWAKEFARVQHVLQGAKSPKGRFLALYSRFLTSEKRAADEYERAINKQEAGKNSTKNYPRKPYNGSLSTILLLIGTTDDAFLLFLKGLLLYKLGRITPAIAAVIESLKGYAWNWSAWQLLSQCFTDNLQFADLRHLLPPNHPGHTMIKIQLGINRQSPEEGDLAACDLLLRVFPSCQMIMGLKAQVLYHMNYSDMAEHVFDEMLINDPYLIDGIDLYGSILYTCKKETKLSKLARRFTCMSRDRPEVCCVIGDHYSMSGEPEKAIKYYRRAVLLDPTKITAWVLMGHAYLELKNGHAAIESYRRASDMRPQDHRAWFGLGQAYALLTMYRYSLHYYHRALTLKPGDWKIWQGLGNSYNYLLKHEEAIECLLRGAAIAPKEDLMIKLDLARGYETKGDTKNACYWHLQYVTESERMGRGPADYAKSCLAIAQAYSQPGSSMQEVKQAMNLLEKIGNSNAEENAEAKKMLETLKTHLGAPKKSM